VKGLKELIKEKAPAEAELASIVPERLILQVEGGDILKKNTAMLDEAGLRDKSTIIVTISDKIPSSSQSTRTKAKDEPKVPIIYTLRAHASESQNNQDGEE
jgi:hypothetical protein